MGLHIENDTRLYWSHKEGNPIHIAVHTAMGENRWHRIHRAFSISDPTLPPGKTVFEKVSWTLTTLLYKDLLTNLIAGALEYLHLDSISSIMDSWPRPCCRRVYGTLFWPEFRYCDYP
jgi:hypothetical protein